MEEKKRVLRENNREIYFRLRGQEKSPETYEKLDGASQSERRAGKQREEHGQRPWDRNKFARSEEGQEGQWERKVINEVKDSRRNLRREQ